MKLKNGGNLTTAMIDSRLLKIYQGIPDMQYVTEDKNISELEKFFKAE